MQLARVAGVQAEMGMGFAGLHQLLVPFLGGLDGLPGPQRQALGAAFGLPIMYLAARSPTRLFRGVAYPLLGVSLLGLGLTLIPGVARSAYGASRWLGTSSTS